MSNEISDILPYIKDLGLPVVALFYLFKCYKERVAKGDEREDKYSEIIESHSKNCGELTIKLGVLADSIEKETHTREKLLSELISVVLTDNINRNRMSPESIANASRARDSKPRDTI